MGTVQERAEDTSADVAFEVDRVEWPSDDRVEIVGRWSGVRGRRFVRPALELEVDGEQCRMLALLDHKPWAPEAGEEWIAAFDWRGEPGALDGAQLTVAPDLSVELQPEGSKPNKRPKPARRSRASVLETDLADARREIERLSRKLQRENQSHASNVTRLEKERTEDVEKLRAELAESQEDSERQLEDLRSKLDSERERLRDQRDAERKRAEGLASELQRARDELASARESAATEADRLTGELEAARQKAERTVALPIEPAADASKLRRVRPGRYRWEASAGEERTPERALAIAALAIVFVILLLLIF